MAREGVWRISSRGATLADAGRQEGNHMVGERDKHQQGR